MNTADSKNLTPIGKQRLRMTTQSNLSPKQQLPRIPGASSTQPKFNF
jgi:hypothetical protein